MTPIKRRPPAFTIALQRRYLAALAQAVAGARRELERPVSEDRRR